MASDDQQTILCGKFVERLEAFMDAKQEAEQHYDEMAVHDKVARTRTELLEFIWKHFKLIGLEP